MRHNLLSELHSSLRMRGSRTAPIVTLSPWPFALSVQEFASVPEGVRISSPIYTIVQLLDQAKRSSNIPTPEIAADTFQSVNHRLRYRIKQGRQSVDHLLEHCKPHCYREVVEHMLGVWMGMQLRVSHALSTVGQEDHLLIHRNSLGEEKLVQPRLGFIVMPGHEAKPACWSVLGNGLDTITSKLTDQSLQEDRLQASQGTQGSHRNRRSRWQAEAHSAGRVPSRDSSGC
jgi:hypothetical protein